MAATKVKKTDSARLASALERIAKVLEEALALLKGYGLIKPPE